MTGRARSVANLRPATHEDAGKRNPSGKNGRTQHEAFVAWMDESDEGKKLSRIGEVWKSTLENALTPKGSLDRKTLLEQYQGKARQQLDLTTDDESLLPAVLAVIGARPAAEPLPLRAQDSTAAASEPSGNPPQTDGAKDDEG